MSLALKKDATQSGYKQTELGLIPEDWEVFEFQKIFKRLNLKKFQVTTSDYSESGNYPIVDQGKNLIAGFTDKKEKLFESPKNGVVVFGDHTRIVKFIDFDFVVGADGTQVLECNEKLNCYFFTSQLKSKDIPNTGYNRHFKFLKDLKFIVPPAHAEQKAIAEALGDADEYIAALEKLIAKKRNIKQGAMQDLLTGKQRLAGFESSKEYKQTELGFIPKDWEICSLGEITVLMTNGFVGTATSQYVENENGILYIQGYNIEENGFNFHGIKYVNEQFHKNHLKSSLREGDLLTIQTGDVGLTAVVTKELEGSNCHALIISRLNLKKYSSKFVSYYMNSDIGRSRLKLMETGTTMKHLNVGDMLEFKFPMPIEIEEQAAIADLLTDMDSEISTLETKLEKAKQIKQGMMQDLLSGKVRLI